jgi:hypothetical protein
VLCIPITAFISALLYARPENIRLATEWMKRKD